jgi:hypothetical protein
MKVNNEIQTKVSQLKYTRPETIEAECDESFMISDLAS